MNTLEMPLLDPKESIVNQISEVMLPPAFREENHNDASGKDTKIPPIPIIDKRDELFIKYFQSIPNLLNQLKTDQAKGIITDTAIDNWRIKTFGSNHRKEEKDEAFLKSVYNSCNDITLIILVASAIISIVVGILQNGLKSGWIEGVAIMLTVSAVVIFTAYNEEDRERNFIESRKLLYHKKVIVIRNGIKCFINQEDLLVGDILLIKSGDQIAVDGILIEGNPLMNERIITGKHSNIFKHTSFSRKKINDNQDEILMTPIIISGTYVQRGNGKMIVCTVGEETMYQKYKEKYQIKIVQSFNEESPMYTLDDKLHWLSELLTEGAFIGTLMILIILLSGEIWQRIFTPRDFLTTECIDSFLNAFITTLCFLVTALPEGISFILTISIAYSLSQLKERSILVKNNYKLETLGVIDTICTDKVGTLTQGKMHVKRVYINGINYEIDSYSMSNLGYADKDLLNELFSHNQSTFEAKDYAKPEKPVIVGNSYEKAIYKLLKKNGYKNEESLGMFVLPYSPEYNYMMSLYAKDDEYVLYIRGEPDCVFPFIGQIYSEKGNLPIKEKIPELEAIDIEDTKLLYKPVYLLKKTISKDEFEAAMKTYPHQGIDFFKALAVNSVLYFSLAIEDSLHSDAAQWIIECHLAGINLKLVTDDDFAVAISFAKKHNIISSPEYDKATKDIQIINAILSNENETEELKKERLIKRKVTSPIALTGKQFQQLTKGLKRQKDKDEYGRSKIIYQLHDKEAFSETVKHLKVIAMVSSEDKLLLLYGLREIGMINALSVSHSNDLHALREAVLGIGMGKSGSDIAKDCSDLILLDDSFKSILTAFKYGRNLFDNVRKFLQFHITSTLVTVLITLIGSMLFKECPLSPLKLLWINFIINPLASLAFAFENPNKEILLRRPYTPNSSIFTKTMTINIVSQVLSQLVILCVVLINGPFLFRILSDKGLDHNDWDVDHGYHLTIFFNILVYLQVFNSFNAKKLHQDEPNDMKNVWENPLFVSIQLFIILIQLLLTNFGGRVVRTQPLSLIQNIICFIFGGLSFCIGHLIRSIPYDSGEEPASYKLKDSDREYREQLENEKNDQSEKRRKRIAKGFKSKKSAPIIAQINKAELQIEAAAAAEDEDTKLLVDKI